MKEIQRRKVRSNTEKPFPGCLGRMVNLFDLSAGVSRNKLLTDKPHRDGDYSLYFLFFFFKIDIISSSFEGLTVCCWCVVLMQIYWSKDEFCS